MILVTANKQFDYVTTQRWLAKIAPFVVTFGLGGWFHSIVEQDIHLPYLKRSTQELQRVQNVAGPNPVATVKCLRQSNKVAASVAGQAVVALQNARIPAPSLQQIPSCPTPAKPYSAVSSKK